MFVKNINLLNKKGYIKENINYIMIIKERGITVGDLLVIFIIILTTTILVKTFNKDKKTTLIYFNQGIISNDKTFSRIIDSKDLSL